MFERSTFGSRDPDTTDKQIDALIDEAEGTGAMVREATGPVAALVAVHRLTVTALVEVLRTSLEQHAPTATSAPLNPWAGKADSDREVIERTVAEAEANGFAPLAYKVERLSSDIAALRLSIHSLAEHLAQKDVPVGGPSDADIDAMENAAAAGFIEFRCQDARRVRVQWVPELPLANALLEALDTLSLDHDPPRFEVRTASGIALDLRKTVGELCLGPEPLLIVAAT